MSVILEFSIDSGDFRLGQVLSGPSGMQFELERVVPTGRMVMPFVWVSGDDLTTFEESVRTNPAVKELLALDRLQESGLYRVEWEESPTNLIEGIGKTDGSILQARGNDEWQFRVRFSDHDALSGFHEYVIDQDIPIHVDRTYTMTGGPEGRFDITPDQREALLLALHRGYFATPRETTLEELADGLDITKQALSNRIRRGNESVLRWALLSPSADTSP
jgi:predicted DNA binding protein